MKLQNNIRILAILVLTLLVIVGEVSSIALRKSDSDVTADSDRHKTGHKAAAHHKKSASSAAVVTNQLPGVKFNATNATISKSLYSDLNNTFVVQDLQTFKVANRRWGDLKLFDKQVEDIYNDIIYQDPKDVNPKGSRAAIQIYVSQFEACDTNKDNVLSLPEFTGCMTNDTYLSQITPPQARFATYTNYTYSNSTGFYPILYNLMDSYQLNYTNFHDYMLLRLMVFSWRKCSVNGPFIDEVSFECAIEIATGSKTITRNTARHLYALALELSNTNSVRNIDFISYYIIAQSARLFGKINNKEDSDITRTEFNLALDSNILPSRYNQDVVNQFFTLVSETSKPNQGLDLLSFVFYDFSLRLFETPNSERKWYLAKFEFTNLFNSYLFPGSALGAVQSIPQNNLTANSYQMYTYLNISAYHQEADHFLKFTQKSDKKVDAKAQLGSKSVAVVAAKGQIMNAAGNITFNLLSTASWLFNILDNDVDGYISFSDFGNFIQIAYLFNKFDPFGKGRVVAGTLYEKFTAYADFPYVSSTLRERAKRFNLFPQDLYMDLNRVVLVLRIDDLINVNVRRVDPTSLYEVELKNIFASVNLGAVPDAYLNKCLRGVDDNNVPKYDWECAFVQATTTTLNYLESSFSYMTAKSANLTLVNTAFVNIDPQIK